jgi:tetratricopeptide (TPR) repeat protein
MVALASDKKKGLARAQGWHEEQPGDLLALVALGEALEATGDRGTAARAYGSIIDLFPSRADLRRFAGVRLERLAEAAELAVDTFARAAEQRPDHPASHRLLAFALLRAGKPEKAFEAISKGLAQRYPEGRFAGVDRILREDAGLIAAAWMKAEPARRSEIEQKLKAVGGTPETKPSLRFVLNWETDANDVDFHITDAKGGHAFYSQKELPSGGELYADVTTGYGPECFTIRLPKGKRAAPYRLQAHYYSIGPMGAGMGKLEIIEHDGAGGLRFEQRPYVVMVNQAFVDLGVVKD